MGQYCNRKNLIISNILIDYETDLVTVKLMWNRLLSIVGKVTDTKHSYKDHSADLCQSLLIWGVSNHQGLSLPHPAIKTFLGSCAIGHCRALCKIPTRLDYLNKYYGGTRFYQLFYIFADRHEYFVKIHFLIDMSYRFPENIKYIYICFIYAENARLSIFTTVLEWLYYHQPPFYAV